MPFGQLPKFARVHKPLLFTIPNMVALWDASNAVATGGAIDSIPDQSGNGNTLLKVGATGPTLTATDSNFNNQPSIGTTIANRRLSVTLADSGAVQPYTVYHVIRCETNSNTVYWRTNAGNFTGSAGFYLQSDRLPRVQTRDAGFTITSGNAITTGGTNYVTCTVYNTTSSAIYFNSSSTANASGTVNNDNLSTITVGSFGSAVSMSWASLVIYSGAHDQSTRAKVMSFLGSKYNISTT